MLLGRGAASVTGFSTCGGNSSFDALVSFAVALTPAAASERKERDIL
jgi:hypothetical protein